MNEKLIKRTLKPNKKFVYDDMEDDTGLNFNEMEECMSAMGVSPTPNMGSSVQTKVNGVPVQGKSKKKSVKHITKKLDESLAELINLLK